MHSLTEPVLRFFADVSVQVGMPQDVGLTLGGKRRLVPILGGEVCGQGWTARVLPGGADFQRILNDQVSELDARYVLETDAGDMIFVQNRAVRTASADVMHRLLRGEPVDPAAVYFRCTPRFETSSKALSWIEERVFLGTGERRPVEVVMRFFEVA